MHITGTNLHVHDTVTIPPIQTYYMKYKSPVEAGKSRSENTCLIKSWTRAQHEKHPSSGERESPQEGRENNLERVREIKRNQDRGDSERGRLRKKERGRGEGVPARHGWLVVAGSRPWLPEPPQRRESWRGERNEERERKNRKREGDAVPCSRTRPHGPVIGPGGIWEAALATVAGTGQGWPSVTPSRRKGWGR